MVDCPPTLGGPTLTALTAARHALIVVDPSALGLRGIGSVADAVDGVWEGANPDLDLCGVVVNRVPAISVEAERRIDELGRIVGRSTIWKPPVPQRVIVNQALGERRPIHAYGSRAADVVHAFDALWTRLRRVLRRLIRVPAAGMPAGGPRSAASTRMVRRRSGAGCPCRRTSGRRGRPSGG